MSLSEFSSVIKAKLLLDKNTTSIEGHMLQGELKAWEKSIEASYKQEGLAQLASMKIDDLYPIDKTTGKPKKGVRAISKLRLAAMKKDNSNFIVTDTSLKLLWELENLPIPKINGTTVSIGEYSTNIDAYTLLDAFNVWLSNTTHTNFSEDILTGKTSKSTYYSYDKNNIEYYGESNTKYSKLNSDINAIRIKKTGHTSTARIMYNFLITCGYTEDYSTFATNYQIGHIDSQAHMKAIVTRAAKDSTAYSGGLIDKLLQLLKYLDLGSSSLKPIHSGIIAAINKDSKNGNATMNLEIQPTGTGAKGTKDPGTNQGSADLSHALNIVAILKNLGSTATDVKSGEQPVELRNIGASADQIAKNLNMLYKNYYKNKEAIQHTLSNFSKDPKLAEFLVDLESSDSMRTFIKKSVIHSLDSKTPKPKFKANLKDVPILKLDNSSSEKIVQNNKKLAADIKQQITKVKQLASKAKATKDTASKSKAKSSGPNFTMPNSPLRSTSGQFYSLTSLQFLLNTHLQDVISANMGNGNRKDILNYRTGRFASTVKVERMSQSREGMITAFYSYMQNPYATFSDGGRQSTPKTRDPKLLIAKSIREIAATKVANRMRAVLA